MRVNALERNISALQQANNGRAGYAQVVCCFLRGHEAVLADHADILAVGECARYGGEGPVHFGGNLYALAVAGDQVEGFFGAEAVEVGAQTRVNEGLEELFAAVVNFFVLSVFAAIQHCNTCCRVRLW